MRDRDPTRGATLAARQADAPTGQMPVLPAVCHLIENPGMAIP